MFYLGASWVFIEAVNFFIEKYLWSDIIFNYTVIVVVFGLPGTLLFQWYHSKKIAQKICRQEILLHSINILFAAYFIITTSSGKAIDNTGMIEEQKSIAVLPFQNLGANEDMDFYGDGFADDIIAGLSKIPDFVIISRTSSFQFKSSPKSINEIGSELNVANILEGSYQIFKDKIRINVNLVNSKSGNNLWSETFNGNLNEIFNLQNQIALQIANSLQLKLSESHRKRIEQNRNVNALAYEYYSKGRDLLKQKYISKNTLDESVEALKKALEIDSSFVEAHIGLAEVYVEYLTWGYDEYKKHGPFGKKLSENCQEI